MLGNTFHQLFLLGANELAAGNEYAAEQQAAGFTEEDWNLLTSDTCWTQNQRMKIPSVLSSAISITLRIAGLPPTALPGAFLAAVICKLVQPCNRLLAASVAPESFDVMSAAGIHGESQIINTTHQQMLALVVYFSSADFAALSRFKVEEMIEDAVMAAQLPE